MGKDIMNEGSFMACLGASALPVPAIIATPASWESKFSCLDIEDA